MIGCLTGKIIDRPVPGRLILDVHGVGYDIETSLTTYFKLESCEDVVLLHIQTIVREDAFLLYGFLERDERALFRALIKVNGVGPKLAIAILSSIEPHIFVQTIQQENTSFLTKIPGIGKKTAERLIVEMKDSLPQYFSVQSSVPVSSPQIFTYTQQGEAIAALEALGYKSQEASKIVRQLDDGQKNAEQLIRQALQHLSKVTH